MPWSGRPSSVVPALVALALAIAIVSLTNTGATELHRILGGMVSRRHSLGNVLDVAAAADLLAFETPAFHDLGKHRHRRLAAPLQRYGHRESGAEGWRPQAHHGFAGRVCLFARAKYFGRVDISGGEWQRVALARAFLQDAALIILDEPTAALDLRSEAALFTNIGELFQGHSTLLISHRHLSVRSADRVYILKAGRVTEHGTHDELMALGGTYAELFALQAAAYLGEPAEIWANEFPTYS